MKKPILAIVLFFVCINFCHGQQPWCPAGASWIYVASTQSGEGYSQKTLVKDTTINGFPGQKIKVLFRLFNFQIRAYETDSGYQYFYNNAGVIFGAVNFPGPFDTIYNFNAAPGDKWGFPFGGCNDSSFVLVTDTGTLLINNQRLKFKSVIFTGGLSMESDTLIERMGYLHNEPFSISVYCATDGAYYDLCSYKDSTFNSYPGNDTSCIVIPNAVVNGLKPDNSFLVYPNPANDVINIQTGAVNQQAEVGIYDMEGRILLSQRFIESAENKVDISNLPAGIFLVELKNKNGTNRQLLVKD